jgi:outer membrane biogenesis lipoprotein LolB
MMKIQYFFLVAVAGFVLSSCAHQKETVVTTTDQTQKRVHTQEELKKTGETQPGPALEKTDAAIQTSHHP